MSSKGHLSLVILIAAFLGLLVAACAGGEQATPTSSGPTATSAPAAPVPTQQPGTPAGEKAVPYEVLAGEYTKRFPVPPPVPPWPPKPGGEFRAAAASKYTTLDPLKANPAAITGNVYNTVVETKVGFYYPETFWVPQYIGSLAEKWDHPDPLTYIFYLRKGINFHNIAPVNGRELVADDVVFSWTTQKKEGIQNQQFTDVNTVEAVDKYSVKVSLKTSVGGFIGKMGSPGYPVHVWPRELYDQKLLAEKSIGTGPFILDEFRPGELYTLRKNPDYWDKDKDGTRLPYLDNIRLYYMPDKASEVAAIRTKKIDHLRLTSIRDVENLTKTNPDLKGTRLAPMTPWRNSALFLRLDKKPWSDPLVRRALSMAVDRQLMFKTVLDGDGSPYTGQIPPWMAGIMDWPLTLDIMGPWYKYDPKEAKRLLAEAGYPNGFKAEYLYVKDPITPMDEYVQFKASQWKENLGIELEVKTVESVALTQIQRSRSWNDIIEQGLSGPGHDWEAWVYQRYRSGAPLNYELEDKQLDEMLDKHRQSESEAERKELQLKIFKYLQDQMYRPAFVAPAVYELWQPYLQNFGPNSYAYSYTFNAHEVRYAWLENDAPGRKK